MTTAWSDPADGGAGGLPRCGEAPADVRGVAEPAGRAQPAADPSGPGDAPVASGGGVISSSSSSQDESDEETLSLEPMLIRLAELQRRLLYWSVDHPAECAVEQQRSTLTAQRKKLKKAVDKLSTRIKLLLPCTLHPLFDRRNAVLYLSVPRRAAKLCELLRPNPDRQSLQDKEVDCELVRRAVKELHQNRFDARIFGTIVGFPGMGKTYLMRLLLMSQAPSAPASSAAVEVESDEVMSWWMSMPLFVISFNGITSATSIDVLLAALGYELPGVVRLLFSEMMRQDGGSDFATFRAAMLEALQAGKLSPSTLLMLVNYVRRTRCREQLDPHPTFVGILLADELVQLSRAPPPSPTCLQRSQRGRPSGGQPLPLPSSSSDSRRCNASSSSDVDPSPASWTPRESTQGANEAMAGHAVTTPVMHGARVAEVTRSALCSTAKNHRLLLCVSSFSEGFIIREKTASGSVPVRIGFLQLVEATRVAAAVSQLLCERKKGFQVTSKSGATSVLTTETVGMCLGVLAGGHPRAAEVLITSIEASRHGEPFLSNFLSRLEPGKLSLASSSVDTLCEYPAVVAVGLLGYEADPDIPFCGSIPWDHVYAQGALTRGVLDRTHRRATRSASRFGAPASPIYRTRLSVAFLLEVLKRKPSRARIESDVGEQSPAATVVDQDLYAALHDVRAALETGDAAVAWERFVFSGLTAVSHARRICSQKLGSLVRDGQEQPPLHKTTLLDLFPASSPYVGDAPWLEAAEVDASRAFFGVRLFRNYTELLAMDDEELLKYVWQAEQSNFPAVDGVIFFKCTGCTVAAGPRRGELVAVMLQLKHKEKINLAKDVIKSAVSAAAAFGVIAGTSSWSRRTAFVVLSHRALPQRRDVDLVHAVAAPVIVVDQLGLIATFGPGLHALIQSSAIAFGTQVVDVTSASFLEG